jgi:two-component system sensor histidine kinase RegB
MQPGLGHQVGMWAAFLVAAVLTASFVTRIRLAVETKEHALAEARRVAAHRERLASLTTLAAGAAHELATPLSTIAVTSKELDRVASAPGVPPSIAEDARLIRTQVDRCREILNQMSGRADSETVQRPEFVAAGTLVRTAVETFPEHDRSRIAVDVSASAVAVQVPLQAASRTLRTIIKNALEASSADAPVSVRVDASQPWVRIEVSDRGVGMSAELLGRIGEPFFTTKPPGSGFGLGLFLVRTFVDQWGGRFEVQSVLGKGTTATLSLPAQPS